MYIISYNVNGIRAALTKGLTDWMATELPDVLCIQESKAQPEQIPMMDFEVLGYHSYWFSAQRRGYSGVGILSRKEPDHVEYGMGIEKYDAEGRVIRADYGELSVISVYHPNGSGSEERHFFKMDWLNDFLTYINELGKSRPKLVVAGDFNICHREIDIHDPVRHARSSGFLPEERKWLSRFVDSGFTDTFRKFNQEPHQYTWWSWRANARQKNLGWRIDYNMTTNNLVSDLKDAGIMPDVKHSDHCPAWVKI
jgi:exodeoxyribonuclease III